MGAALPSGTVTFLFSDVEASTRLLNEHGSAYADLLAEHRRVIREAIRRHEGVEVDTQGDAFFVAFPRAGGAVAAAAEVQTALETGPIRVRIGIHTGEPLVTEEGYVGIDVHRAARIAASAHGDQIVVSETTRRLLETDAPIRDLGEHRLKDLTGNERHHRRVLSLRRRHLARRRAGERPTSTLHGRGRPALPHESGRRLEDHQLDDSRARSAGPRAHGCLRRP